VDIFFIAHLQQQPPITYPGQVNLDIRISKSDWVEKILPNLKYKEVSLIEVPKIENPEFSVVAKIDDAWKMYSMGEYGKVLTECRKALEAFVTILKEKGLQKEIIEKEGKKWYQIEKR
jgi:hypothetical protein